MSTPDSDLRLARERVDAFMERLVIMSAGDRQARFPISPSHDELDAIAFGINVLADELRWANARVAEADRWAAEELRRSKEKAERANEQKSTFLRNASHEIRTPISVILTIAELLALPGLSSEERADLVVRLRANSRAVLALLGDLLDLSRLEAGRLPVMTEAVSPIAVVRDVLLGLEPEARRKGLELRVDVEPNAHDTIASDGHRLRQILVNVLGNALKFTERGSVHVLVGSVRAADRDQLTIDVADTGIGIPADRHERLFEPFEQASPSISRIHGGTGLGLTLSRRLAEELGGTLVLVQSEPGRGTRFRLTLEAFPVEAGESAASPVPGRGQEGGANQPLDGVRILLADDSADLRLAVGRLLRTVGASVDFALDGQQAVAMTMSNGFDIVLMDLLMPGLDGLGATRELRRLGCTLPIIAITADVAPRVPSVFADAGCSAVFAKPFDSDDLIASIRVLLGHEVGDPARLGAYSIEPHE